MDGNFLHHKVLWMICRYFMLYCIQGNIRPILFSPVTVCKWRRSKITWGENNLAIVYSVSSKKVYIYRYCLNEWIMSKQLNWTLYIAEKSIKAHFLSQRSEHIRNTNLYVITFLTYRYRVKLQGGIKLSNHFLENHVLAQIYFLHLQGKMWLFFLLVEYWPDLQIRINSPLACRLRIPDIARTRSFSEHLYI